ncbi:lipid kinase [Pelagibacterium montanilacus]|uniref:lipid kinase n=1 Tax=Pelagibacterium montanilacus TaxID=2185280 RepID=UPI000F8E5E09|nr:lipid kinase [Pelagibacterium montanilacus]
MSLAPEPVSRRALVLANPNSGGGAAMAAPILKRLRFLGLDPIHAELGGSDEVCQTILDHREGVDLVVLCGGDGTMNAAAPALIETGLPMGIVPLGTANDLARTLEIPTDLIAAIDIIAGGARRCIDVGLINDRPFFNVASIGLSTKVAHELTKDIKRRWGRFGYAVTAARIAFKAETFAAEIVSEHGTQSVRALQIAVGNGRFYGGGAAVRADARIDDGTLDLYSLETRNVWKLAFMLGRFQRGEHGLYSEVRTDRGKTFEIRTPHPMEVNVDGDIVTETPARFGLMEGAIKVFVPR